MQLHWLIKDLTNNDTVLVKCISISLLCLRFPIKNSSNKNTEYTSCFIIGGLTGRPGDLMKNLETPGKTGRVGRSAGMSMNYSFPLLDEKSKIL